MRVPAGSRTRAKPSPDWRRLRAWLQLDALQRRAERVESIRPELLHIVRCGAIPQLGVCERDDTLAAPFWHEPDDDDRAVGPSEPHRLGRLGRAHGCVHAAKPAATGIVIGPLIEQRADG